MAGQKFSKTFFLSKKSIFISGLILLTIGLMILFRKQDLKSYVEKQKANLADFYAQNLEPLFSANKLTNEDIFNFAFYKELPIDKQNNQVLQLGSENDGKEYFEFRNTKYNPKTNNLEQFKEVLELNAKQKGQLDSILNSYQGRIQTQVLVNDRNTLAINSNLWNLNKALMADMLLFASKANNSKFKRVFPEEFYSANAPSISKMVSDVKSFNNNKYIFVHSDTIFTKEFNFDKTEPLTTPAGEEKQLDSRLRIKLNRDLVKSHSQTRFGRRLFDVKIDSNSCRVQIPNIPEVPVESEIHRLNVELEKATKELKNISIKFRTPIPPVPPVRTKAKRGTTSTNRTDVPIPPKDNDSSEDFEINIDLPNVDSIVQAAMSFSIEAMKNVRFNMDSIQTAIDNDTMLSEKEKAKLKGEMQKLKKLKVKKLKK